MIIQNLSDKNTLYLSLAISPVMGFLFIDYNLILSLFFLFSLALGVSFAANCINLIKVRVWISLLAFFSFYGFFLAQFWQATPIYYIGVFFLGMGTGGMIYSLPLPSLTVSASQRGKSPVGFGFALSVAIGFLWKELLERNTYFTLFPALFFTLFFVWKTSIPPTFDNLSICEAGNFLSRKKTCLLVMFCAFTLLMSFSVGTGTITIIKSMDQYRFAPLIFAAGIFGGILMWAFVMDKKGCYSASTLLIFLCEVSVCFSLYECSAITYILTVFSTALCVGYIACQPFWISSFVIGKTNGCISSKWILFSEIVGLAFSIHAQHIPLFCKSDSNYSPIPLLVILVICFFLFFYLWKKRLILLKT